MPAMTAENAPLLVMENVSEINRELYFEGVRARRKGLRLYLFTALGILLVPTGLLMYKFWVWGLGLVIVLLAQFSHIMIGWRDFGKLRRLHPSGVWTKTVRFYDDRIESRSGQGPVRTARYRDLKQTGESEHLYIVEFRSGLPAVLLRKDGFTTGEGERLRSFLRRMEEADYEAAKQQSPLYQWIERIRREKLR